MAACHVRNRPADPSGTNRGCGFPQLREPAACTSSQDPLHGGRTIEGVSARITQRLLALTAAIWHNRHTSQPVTRSLIAYDH